MTCENPTINFNKQVKLTDLPTPFQTAIAHSQTTKQTSYDDIVVGSICTYGYCSDPKYSETPYCACVNAAVPWPACAFGPCVNNPLAYRPIRQHKWVTDKKCPSSIYICQNLSKIRGDHNQVDLYQKMSCGAVAPKTNTTTSTVDGTTTVTNEAPKTDVDNFKALIKKTWMWLVLAIFGIWIFMPRRGLAPPDSLGNL